MFGSSHISVESIQYEVFHYSPKIFGHVTHYKTCVLKCYQCLDINSVISHLTISDSNHIGGPFL